MNPLACVLNDQAPMRTPLWIMRQAGRYLPEYCRLREKAGSFWSLCQNPQWAAEATLMPIRRFDFDAAIVFSDILTIPLALGVKVVFSEKGPQLEGIENFLRLGSIVSPEALQPVYESLMRVRAMLDPSVSLFGFAGAPWTLASYLVAGKGGDEQKAAKLYAYRRPKEFERLIDVLCDAVAGHLIAQIKAGADVVQIFDSWAGGLSERQFTAYVLEPTKRIVASVRKKIPDAKIIGFPRRISLDGYRRYANETGVDGVSLDTSVPLSWASQNIKGVIQGNLDPLALLAGGDVLESEAAVILEAMRGKRFVFNLGHGILPETPVDNVAQLVRIVRGFQ